MLHVKDITYRVGDRTLFEGASAHIPAGKRIGLVGANGSGKTTLLNIITGELELDGGRVDLRGGCTVGTVAQEALSGVDGPLDIVLRADEERTALMHEAETATDPTRIAAIHNPPGGHRRPLGPGPGGGDPGGPGVRRGDAARAR